eukprot:scaffold181206_cov22-Tisochrysis_lutea.AAC.4
MPTRSGAAMPGYDASPEMMEEWLLGHDIQPPQEFMKLVSGVGTQCGWPGDGGQTSCAVAHDAAL